MQDFVTVWSSLGIYFGKLISTSDVEIEIDCVLLPRIFPLMEPVWKLYNTNHSVIKIPQVNIQRIQPLPAITVGWSQN